MTEDGAQETWEYLALCEELGVTVSKFPASGWMIGKPGSKRPGGHGATLKEAYEDYLRHNEGVRAREEQR